MSPSRAACWLAALMASVAPAGRAEAQEPRGVHVRAHLTGHGALGWPVDGWPGLIGGGHVGGVDLAVHANHDVGLRAIVFVYSAELRGVGLWRDDTWTGGMLAYRFHDDVVVGRFAPFVEVAGGYGQWWGCIRGDWCGGQGPLGAVSAGVELALERHLAMLLGAQVLAQGGLVNGVNVLVAPTLFFGLRAG